MAPASKPGGGEAEHECGGGERYAAEHHHGHHASGAGAERHAESDLAAADAQGGASFRPTCFGVFSASYS
jgi:hypothetical protein